MVMIARLADLLASGLHLNGQLAARLLLSVSLCLAFSGFGFATEAHASAVARQSTPHVTVQYCASSQEQLSLETAKQCSYVNYADAAPLAQGNAVRWARIDATTTELSQTLTINAGPHLVNEVEVFDGQTGEKLGGPVGLAYPYSPEHGLLVGYTFSVTPGSIGEHTYYVRIVTSTLPYAFVQATLDPMTAQTMSQQIGLGIHLGVVSLLVFISAAVYAVTRTPIMGVFALVILNLLLSTLAGSGFLMQHVWPESPRLNELFFSTMFYLRAGLWLWLAQTFLGPYRTPRWYRPSCQVAYGIVAVTVILSWLGLSTISSLITLIFAVFVFPLGQLIAIKTTTDIRPLYQRILILGYALGTLAMWAALLVVIYPTDNPQLPIQISRVIDYANPVVLLGLVMFHYRETILQLAATKEENVAIKLGLELEQKLQRERKLMVDMLTHELKNPLASISMAAGSLASTLAGDDALAQRRLQNIDQSVRSMDSVIERCNLMNQLDQSALQCNPTRINLGQVLSDTIARFADGKRVVVKVNAPNEIITDAQFFQIIASNLIDNALRYSRTGSDVDVCIQREATNSSFKFVMEVTNQIGSKGVPDASLVFDRFYRHDLAHTTSGSGVGLYLAQALAQLTGGHIVYQHSDTHVIFRLELPEGKHDD